jgi:hypothetical protein
MTFPRQYDCLWESKALSGAAHRGSAGLLFARTALTRRRTIYSEAKQRAKRGSLCAFLHKVLILRGMILLTQKQSEY